MSHLSDRALAQFRLHVERNGQIDVDAGNRDAYRELESAGLVVHRRPFTGNRLYALTELGRRTGDSLTAPSPSISA